MKKDYFHISEVEPQELVQVLFRHFSFAQTRELVIKFQKQNTQHFLEVACDEDGIVKSITPSKGFPSDELDEIEKIIQDTLITKHGTKIGQLIGFCDEKITGYFRYKDLFQILPMPDDAPRPDVALAEHPFILEVPYETCPIIIIDHARKQKKGAIYTRLLNLLSNQFISLGSRSTQFAWTYSIDDMSNLTSKWTQLGYVYSGLKGTVEEFSQVDKLQPIERVFYETYYGSPLGTSGEPFKLPDNLEQSLDKVFAFDEDNWRKFFMACSWYAQYQDTWVESYSSAFIAMVTALECLAQEKETCKSCNQPLIENIDLCQTCGQPRYRLTRHFQEFLKKYFPAIDKFPKEKKTIYQVRSQLAHGADLLRADLEPWNFLLNAKVQEQRQLQYNLHYIVGIAIYNWLHMV